MLARKYRATRADISDTMKTGEYFFGKVLNAKISRGKSEKPGFAIVISKKNEKTSVGRHFIKRKISSYIEENLAKISPNFHKTIVFLMKKSEPKINYSDVKKDVLLVLKKVAF